MKTVLWLIAIALLLPSLGARAQDTGQYRDDFGEVSYGGSDGSLDWVADWVESESDGQPDQGALHVGSEHCSNNKCLHIENSPLLPANLAISRKADLSGFAGAHLSYDLYVAALLSTSSLTVEVRGGGNGWTQVKKYGQLLEAGHHSDSVDVTAYIGSDFEIRFRVEGLTGGGLVTVDRVVIEGPVQPSTTTTTTTPSTTTTHRSTTSTGPDTTTSGSTATTVSPTMTTGDGQAGSSDGGAASAGTGEETEHAGGGPPLSSSTATLAPEAGDPGPPNAIGVGGLRDPVVGLLADYRAGLLGDLEFADTEVLGVDIDADFSMVVEVFEAAQIWIAALSLVVATAIIAGIDRRRRSEQNRRP